MTAPHQTTLEDVESMLTEPAPTAKVTDLKLEGDTIPEEFRGKSVAELVQMTEGLKKSLLLSEQVRANMGQAPVAPPPAPPKPEEPKELTDEELAQIHAEDPVKAIRIMQAQAVRIATQNLEARVQPLLIGTSSAVENGARTKYPDEFAALGTEIQSMIDQLPNKSILSDPVAWDQIINYVRGSNFKKMMDYSLSKTRSAAAEDARNAQAAIAGAVFTPTQSVPAGGQPIVADEYTKEIARNLNMSLEDYFKWKDV